MTSSLITTTAAKKWLTEQLEKMGTTSLTRLTTALRKADIVRATRTAQVEPCEWLVSQVQKEMLLWNQLCEKSQPLVGLLRCYALDGVRFCEALFETFDPDLPEGKETLRHITFWNFYATDLQKLCGGEDISKLFVQNTNKMWATIVAENLGKKLDKITEPPKGSLGWTI